MNFWRRILLFLVQYETRAPPERVEGEGDDVGDFKRVGKV